MNTDNICFHGKIRNSSDYNEYSSNLGLHIRKMEDFFYPINRMKDRTVP